MILKQIIISFVLVTLVVGQNLPLNFSWSQYEGRNLITSVQSQKSPHSCGSCWAMATAQALSDRIKIQRYLQNKNITSDLYSIRDSETVLSSQLLLSCDNRQAFGCFGGQIMQVYGWIKDNNITDETCSPYQAKGEKNPSPDQCNPMSFCGSQTKAVPNYKSYNVASFGQISGEATMMREIFQRGPIVCYMRTDENFDFNYHSGIYIDTSGINRTDHAVSIVGWGQLTNRTLLNNQSYTESIVKYWILRNTYGSFWGDGGFMKIIRGVDNAGIEQQCVWATPTKNATKEQLVPRTKVYIDWRNVNGTNFVQPLRNLRSPRPCTNASWAEAAISSFGARINIEKKKEGKIDGAPIRLSLQSVINCVGQGKCTSNKIMSPLDAYEMAIRQGIPDESCNSFEGEVDIGQDMCEGIGQCKYCYLPHYPFTEMNDNCTSLPSEFTYQKYLISSYQRVSLNDTETISSLIAQEGPIACEVNLNKDLLTYSSGILKMNYTTQQTFTSHWVTLIGWGRDLSTEQDFWIAQNNWGSYWGEYGFFRFSLTPSTNQDISPQCYSPSITAQEKSKYSQF